MGGPASPGRSPAGAVQDLLERRWYLSRGCVRSVSLPLTPGLTAAAAALAQEGALASESRASVAQGRGGLRRKTGSPVGLGAHGRLGRAFAPSRPYVPRGAGEQAATRTCWRGRGSEPHCACPAVRPAEAVVPGRAPRAARISNCPAPGRRGRVGRGFLVAVPWSPRPRGVRADERAASPCPVGVSRQREKQGPVPSPPDRFWGTEPARGAGTWNCEAAER